MPSCGQSVCARRGKRYTEIGLLRCMTSYDVARASSASPYHCSSVVATPTARPAPPGTDLLADTFTDPPTDPPTNPPTNPPTRPPTDPLADPLTDPFTDPITDPFTDPHLGAEASKYCSPLHRRPNKKRWFNLRVNDVKSNMCQVLPW